MSRNIVTADISARLKLLRKYNKISQEKMAELLEMTVSNYIKVENAYQNVTITHLKNICTLFKILADTLLFGNIDVENSLNFDDFIELSKIFSVDEIEKSITKLNNILKVKKKEKNN